MDISLLSHITLAHFKEALFITANVKSAETINYLCYQVVHYTVAQETWKSQWQTKVSYSKVATRYSAIPQIPVPG